MRQGVDVAVARAQPAQKVDQAVDQIGRILASLDEDLAAGLAPSQVSREGWPAAQARK